MIAACDTQDFVPFGREYCRRHPGKFQLQVQNAVQAEHGLPLLKSFRDISIQENNKVCVKGLLISYQNKLIYCIYLQTGKYQGKRKAIKN